MKKIVFFIIISFFYSCGKDKVIQLPEIQHANISKIDDVSAAYLFYDETKMDSVDLNRKNIISSTNWLINVDKRFTLKQVIPHITFLQDKKASSSHKKENTKNYFTCNDLSRKNLGFIEFTDVVYHDEPGADYFSKTANIPNKTQFNLTFISSEDIKNFSIAHLKSDLKNVSHQQNEPLEIVLHFHKNLTFQEYITIKSILLNLDLKSVSISNHEFIFN